MSSTIVQLYIETENNSVYVCKHGLESSTELNKALRVPNKVMIWWEYISASSHEVFNLDHMEYSIIKSPFWVCELSSFFLKHKRRKDVQVILSLGKQPKG